MCDNDVMLSEKVLNKHLRQDFNFVPQKDGQKIWTLELQGCIFCTDSGNFGTVFRYTDDCPQYVYCGITTFQGHFGRYAMK